MRRIDFRRNRVFVVLSAACVLAAYAMTARAEKVVSREEAAQGWISLFDGETLFGWNQIGDAQWRAEDGNIVCDHGSGGWIATTTKFADFDLSLKFHVKGDTSSGVVFRGALDGHPSENGSAVILIKEPTRGDTPWHDIKVHAEGDKIEATVDGQKAEGVTASNGKGYIGFQFFGTNFDSKAKTLGRVEATDIKLKPLSLKPIFNGKDLSEWSIIPGHQSEFTVVDGAINIKKGNGQIETKGTYKNFCLQLDIFSNGDHLNSGVFFRNPPGIFWRGYESQVRNQWMGDDRTKPIDYGTGAIYGVQAARKVVSSDREWFNKTIVVDGDHFSVWVNGFQAADLTDTRPVEKGSDGKVGYVPNAGTIHLQGHDPTTDLSFKNINLEGYPEK